MNLAFSDDLLPAIQAGTKIHTFRAGSRWRAGTMIHFFARNRKPGMYQFFPKRPVVSVQAAELTAEGMHVDGRRLEGAELELFARRDGFATAADFFAFFVGRELPIVGQLIHWTPVRYGPEAGANFPAHELSDEEREAQLVDATWQHPDSLWQGQRVPDAAEARRLNEDYREAQLLDIMRAAYPDASGENEQYDGGPGVDYDPRC